MGIVIAFEEGSYPFSSCYAPSYSQNNAFMAGDIGALCVFIESSDEYELREGERYLENWETVNENSIYGDVQSYIFNDVSEGAGSWFTDQYDRFIPDSDNRYPLTFEFFREDVEIYYEPAYHVAYTGVNRNDDLWLSKFLGEFSEIKEYPFTSISDICEYYKERNDKDWFYIIFIINDFELQEHNMHIRTENEARPENERLEDYELDLIPSHWTYTWQDFIVLPFYHWLIFKKDTLADPFVHETSHIFGATDEYVESSWCGGTGDSVLRIPNLNHETCGNTHGEDCIMGNNQSSQYYEEVLQNAFWNGYLCKYTAWQIGWRDLDCDGLIDPLDENPFEIDKPELTCDPAGNPPVVRWEYPECHSVDYYEYRVDDGEWQYLGYVNQVSLGEVMPDIEYNVWVRAVNDALKRSPCYESEGYYVMSDPITIKIQIQVIDDLTIFLL